MLVRVSVCYFRSDNFCCPDFIRKLSGKELSYEEEDYWNRAVENNLLTSLVYFRILAE